MDLALISVDPLQSRDPAELLTHAVRVASALVTLAVRLAGRPSMN